MNRSGRTNQPVIGELVTALAMGGAENLAVQIANSHVFAGGEAHLIVMSGPGPLSDRINPKVSVHYLGYFRESIKNPLKFLVSVIKGYRLLTAVAAKNGIEVLQTHLPDANLWGLLLALTRKCRVFVTIHNNVVFGDKQRSWMSGLLITNAYKLMFRRCDGVIACSDAVRNSLLDVLGNEEGIRARLHVVTNGVMRPEGIEEEKKNLIRKNWGVPPDEFLIVAAGRFTEAKNFSFLVDSVSLLVEQGFSPFLVIGGEGPLRPSVIAQVRELGLEERVHVPGNIPDLTDLMLAADCLAMSSQWEGLPLVLLEGMIRGLPVVGTRIKGIADTLSDGVEGYLVEVNDITAMAGAIRKLIESPDQAQVMGEAGRKLVEEKFSFERVYEDLVEVFDWSA